jgi:hypothetical protein
MRVIRNAITPQLLAPLLLATKSRSGGKIVSQISRVGAIVGAPLFPLSEPPPELDEDPGVYEEGLDALWLDPGLLAGKDGCPALGEKAPPQEELAPAQRSGGSADSAQIPPSIHSW